MFFGAAELFYFGQFVTGTQKTNREQPKSEAQKEQILLYIPKDNFSKKLINFKVPENSQKGQLFIWRPFKITRCFFFANTSNRTKGDRSITSKFTTVK